MRSWRNLSAAAAVLLPIIGFVVYSSLQVGVVDCEVCMAFDGREVCRSASAANRDEALRSATDNACASLASGMTETMRCLRADPAHIECRDAGESH